MKTFKFENKEYPLEEDYTKKRNEAAAKGDKAGAGHFERLHNAKIDHLGMKDVPKTYDYIDLGTEIQSDMKAGASPQAVFEKAMARQNKANTTPGLGEFAYDPIQDAAMRYALNGMSGAGVNLENRPTYSGKWDSELQKMYDRVMSGEEFSYNPETDPQYQAFREMYTREGNRAMEDTLARLSQNAGGMNSNAVSAAAQANNYYMQQLGDKIPELQQMAYQMYLNEQNQKRQDLAMVQGLATDDFNRYLGEYDVYNADRGWATDAFKTYYNQNRADEQWDYTTAEAAKASARNEINTMIQMGQTPPDALFEAAGIEDKDTYIAMAEIYGTEIAAQMQSQALQTQADILDLKKKGLETEAYAREFDALYGNFGGYTGNYTPDGKPKTEPDDKPKAEPKDKSDQSYINNNSALGLGFGPVSIDFLDNLTTNGEIEAYRDENGIIRFRKVDKKIL